MNPRCQSRRKFTGLVVQCSLGTGHIGPHENAAFGWSSTEPAAATPDPVNHPAHYRLASGVEVIDLTEQLDFLRGNAVKYLARAGRKDGVDELEDLRKAQWYVNRAVENLERSRRAGA